MLLLTSWVPRAASWTLRAMGALFLGHRGDGGGDLVDLGDGLADAPDRRDGLACGALHAGDLLADLLRRLGQALDRAVGPLGLGRGGHRLHVLRGLLGGRGDRARLPVGLLGCRRHGWGGGLHAVRGRRDTIDHALDARLEAVGEALHVLTPRLGRLDDLSDYGADLFAITVVDAQAAPATM